MQWRGGLIHKHISITTTKCQINISSSNGLNRLTGAHTVLPISFNAREKCRKESKVDEKGSCVLKYCPNCIYSLWAGSASVTKPAHPPTSPPTEQSRREHAPALKWQLTPQTKLNHPQREHYSNNTQRPPLCAAALWQQLSSGVRSDLITEALWTFTAHVIWATSRSATMNYLPCFSPTQVFV